MRKRRKRGESVNSRPPSPVSVYLEWSGSKGKIYYYDKEEKEKKYLPSLEFALLDSTSSVVGFDSKAKKGIRGTEVRNLNEEKIQTWIGGNKGPKDLYKNLKSQINGLKFAKVFYVTPIKDGKKCSGIVKLTLSGSSFSAFMDMKNGVKEYKGNGELTDEDLFSKTFLIKDKVKKKNGSNTYYEPLFEVSDMDEDIQKQSDKVFEELEDYLIKLEASENSSYETSEQDEYEEEEETSDSTTDENFDSDIDDPADIDELPF